MNLVDVKLSEFPQEELTKLPRISNRNWIGEETIRLHLRNSKKMDWYISEYDQYGRRLFGFLDSHADGFYWGLFSLDELLNYGKKGSAWQVVVDRNWMPVKSKDIDALKGYINLMLSLPDI